MSAQLGESICKLGHQACALWDGGPCRRSAPARVAARGSSPVEIAIGVLTANAGTSAGVEHACSVLRAIAHEHELGLELARLIVSLEASPMQRDRVPVLVQEAARTLLRGRT